MKNTETVINGTDHAVDLADGRVVAPWATVEGVDVSIEHNANLVSDGHLSVVEKPSSGDGDKRKSEKEQI